MVLIKFTSFYRQVQRSDTLVFIAQLTWFWLWQEEKILEHVTEEGKKKREREQINQKLNLIVLAGRGM